MKKYELKGLLYHIIDIVDNRSDPYAEMDSKLISISDLCAQAIGRAESVPGASLMPTFKKQKKRFKK